mmetsp:Transcript_25808/g.38407  ORF Transcript_25808/g.38407 Transcript_25808/m.38407 type:complete len:105 (-) Transcript_25808:92-406(-)
MPTSLPVGFLPVHEGGCYSLMMPVGGSQHSLLRVRSKASLAPSQQVQWVCVALADDESEVNVFVVMKPCPDSDSLMLQLEILRAEASAFVGGLAKRKCPLFHGW